MKIEIIKGKNKGQIKEVSKSMGKRLVIQGSAQEIKKCHARVGIGVVTLGCSCPLNEGHDGPHGYIAKNPHACNKHPKGCP